MTKGEVQKLIENGVHVPPFPLIVQTAMEIVAMPNSSIGEIADVIASDQAFSSRVLRTVNSSYYCLARTVTSIRDAIAFLGLNETLKIIYALSARSIFGRAQSAAAWEHAFTCALFAEKLDSKNNLNPNQAYLAGLFHDVGKLFLQEYSPQLFFQSVHDSNLTKKPLVEVEREIFGMDHAEIGGMIVDKWNLTEEIGEAIRLSHSAEGCDEPVARILQVSNRLAHYSENRRDSRYSLDKDLISSVGLNADQVATLVAKVRLKVTSYLVNCGSEC
jgi:putative nucleotidyltransferase with HDIG domain